jgi:hypothetical protein
MQTATEFAAGRGHPDYPLLTPRQSPSSRVPCTDFSPWLRGRLAAGDTDAAVVYILQIIAANPGIAVGVDIGGQVSRLGHDAPAWMHTWKKEANDVLDVEFTTLCATTPGWELDLRTILVMMKPLQSPFDATAMADEAVSATTLAATMACHDARLADPNAVAGAANENLRAWKKDLDHLNWPEVTVEEISPPPPVGIPHVLYDLPLGTRSHLFDISQRRQEGPGTASSFSTHYRTRQVGCADEESLDLLVRYGLLRPVDEPDAVWRANAQRLTIAQLRELLTGAGITQTKSAKKAAVVDATRPIRDAVIAAAGNERAFEGTPEGERVISWVRDRVGATRKMWAAWGASRQRDLDAVSIGFDDINIADMDPDDHGV